MFIRRDRLTQALVVVALIALALALFLRPRSLAPDSVHFAAQVAPVAARASRKTALPGVSFAIDSLESDGAQRPIQGTQLETKAPIVVHGWAVAPDTLSPGDQLDRSVDGGPELPVTTYGLVRPDVGTAINPSAVNSGFSATIPTAGLQPGNHTIRFVLKAAGKQFPLSTAVTFTLR